MSDGAVEIPNPLAAAEMSVEQNYDMIDGRINNEPPKDISKDGDGEKPSVLQTIREAQKAPKPPRKEKAGNKHKSKGDIEL